MILESGLIKNALLRLELSYGHIFTNCTWGALVNNNLCGNNFKGMHYVVSYSIICNFQCKYYPVCLPYREIIAV